MSDKETQALIAAGQALLNLRDDIENTIHAASAQFGSRHSDEEIRAALDALEAALKAPAR